MAEYENLFLILISLTIILIFIAYFIYLYRSGPAASDGTLACLPTQCVVNRFSGIKICANTPDEVLRYDPTVETCSNKFTCSDNINRFAEQTDGSTSSTGLCQPGIACNCYNRTRCSNSTLSIFSTENGNPYQDITKQAFILQEIPYYIDTNEFQSPVLFTNPPLRIPRGKELTNFCTIPYEWITNAYPAPNNLQNDGTWYPGKKSNDPCLKGVFVFVPDDPSNFNISNYQKSFLGCMVGSPIPNCTIPYFDKQNNVIKCLQ